MTTLEDVANNGNTMSNTIIYENTGTSLVTDGNVGIVTRTPDANLHVVGNVHVADTTEAFSDRYRCRDHHRWYGSCRKCTRGAVPR